MPEERMYETEGKEKQGEKAMGMQKQGGKKVKD